MEEDNKIDQFFKHGLSDPDIPFRELDWEKMEHKLNAQKKKRVIPVWWFAGAGIAAVLLIFLFWFFSPSPVLIEKTKKNVGTENPVKSMAEPGYNIGSLKSVIAENQVKKEKSEREKNLVILKLDTDNPLKKKEAGALSTVVVADIPAKKDEVIFPDQSAVAIVESEPGQVKTGEPADPKKVKRNIKDKMTLRSGPTQRLTLSLMAAPDISSAKQNISSKLSSNIGLLATYALTNKLSVTSGVVYSKKLYNSGGNAPQINAYAGGQGVAWQVDADCSVLDIPVNVNYKVFNKKKLAVSLNAGLSSYFMLKEKYKFITGTSGPEQKISNLEINNQNQHLFGIANLSVSFEREVGNGLSIGVAPFVKLPLTGIGYSEASLKSAGLSFSLNIGVLKKR